MVEPATLAGGSVGFGRVLKFFRSWNSGLTVISLLEVVDGWGSNPLSYRLGLDRKALQNLYLILGNGILHAVVTF